MGEERTWFVASGLSRRLYVPAAQPDGPPPAVQRAVLVVPAAALPLGPSLTADEAWAVDGAVVMFLGSPTTQPQLLPAALDAFLSNPARGGTVALWVDNPVDAPAQWRARALAAEAKTPVGGRLAGLAVLPLRNFAVRAEGGSWLTVMDETGEWRLEHPPGVRGALRFTGRYGAVATTIAGPLRIDLGPDAPGTLRFELRLPPALEEAFDVGLHFFAEEPDVPGSGMLRGPRLALTPFPGPGFSFAATIDPLALLDPNRTQLRLYPPRGTLESTLCDELGRPLSLAPLDDFRLAFAGAPGTAAAGVDDPLCLTPVGRATVSSTATVLPGLAASELIALPPATATLTLEPGGAAMATALVPGASAQPLSARATTSWARIATDPPNPQPTYYAQPTGAELHSSAAPISGFMKFLPVPLASVDARTRFPLAPWAGEKAPDVAFDTQLEAAAVSPARRAAMSGRPRPQSRTLALAATGTTPAVTPQGLLVELAADSTFAKLRLAICGRDELAMHGVGDPLLGALMTNRQFAVLTSPTVVAGSFTDNAIRVDEWKFALAPSGWAQHGTMMIFKNSPRSVADLAADPASWTAADALNVSAATASAALSEWATSAIEKAKESSVYEPIAKALTDPAWNGILFVNAPVPLDALPDTLTGLAPGIDASRFYAHHLRIDTTPVHDPASKAAVDSAIYALIDYKGPGPLDPAGAPYAFQVDSLGVLIESSAVSGFASEVTLAADELFGAPVKVGTNLLKFAGHYQKQQDAYFFALDPGSDGHTFRIREDATVESFKVNAGTFATVHDAPSHDKGTAQVHSRFSLDGLLAFGTTHEDFDLFGFDVLPTTGIAIDVRFDREQPQHATLSFDPTIALIDPSGIVARKGSLPHGFPITPKAFLAGGPAQPPTDLPVLPVRVPQPWDGPRAPWFGLEFDLDLGTVGALAGKAGLIARLVLQWSPSADPGRWAVGLGLPGATGGTTSMSVMGVLKISMYAIELNRLDAGGFMLALEGIALSVFGHSIPPGGAVTLAVFGDPAATGPSPLAWYGAYTADGGSAVGNSNKQEVAA